MSFSIATAAIIQSTGFLIVIPFYEDFYISLLILKTLWPVPENVIRQAARGARRIVVVEMNLGQYVREIQRVLPRNPIDFCGQMDGRLITPASILEVIDRE